MGKHSLEEPKPKRSRSRILRVFIWSLLIGVVILAVGFYYLYSFYSKVTSQEQKISFGDLYSTIFHPGETVFAGRDHINILCLGLDQNFTEKNIMFTKGARSDTIFVIHLDLPRRSAGILSIPRDTWVKISDTHGNDRINAAFSIGGAQQAMETIQNFLGVPLDYYLIFRVEMTKKLVDALGGVPINVEKDMDYDDNWGHLHVHLKKGWQRLNGEQAVGYSRFRHDEEGDRGRLRRQQQVVTAMARELKKPANLARIDKIVKVFQQYVETNMRYIELFDLYRVFKDFDRKNMVFGAIDGEDAEIEGASVIIPDETKKEKMVNRILRGIETHEPSDIKVEVLNGSGKAGLARSEADKLSARGFQIVRVENADRSDYLRTRIIDHTGSPQVAVMVADIIGPAEILQDEGEPDPQRTVDVTVIVGKDKEIPPSGETYFPGEIPVETATPLHTP